MIARRETSMSSRMPRLAAGVTKTCEAVSRGADDRARGVVSRYVEIVDDH